MPNKMQTLMRGRRRLLAGGSGRPADPSGRTTHTMYPVKHILVTGELTTGFQFYGPFDTVAEAGQWATYNLRPGTAHRVHDMYYIGGEGS